MLLTLNDSEIAHLHAILVDNLTTTFREKDDLCRIISAHHEQIRRDAFVPDGYQIHVLSVLADLNNIAHREGLSSSSQSRHRPTSVSRPSELSWSRIQGFRQRSSEAKDLENESLMTRLGKTQLALLLIVDQATHRFAGVDESVGRAFTWEESIRYVGLDGERAEFYMMRRDLISLDRLVTRGLVERHPSSTSALVTYTVTDAGRALLTSLRSPAVTSSPR